MDSNNLKKRIFKFLEEPDSLYGLAFHNLIIMLIIVTASIFGIKAIYPEVYTKHQHLIDITDYAITIIFFIEITTRFICAPSKKRFFLNPYSIIDIIAVFPSLLGFYDIAALRTLRLIRIFRIFSEVRYMSVLRFRGSVLEKIAPVVLVFIALKFFMWFLEYNDIWPKLPNVNDLLTIIGFSLGIILSLKLGATYEKYLKISETILKMRGMLLYFYQLAIRNKDETGTDPSAVIRWAKTFVELFKQPERNNKKFMESYSDLMEIAEKMDGRRPEIFSADYASLASNAAFILGIGRGKTPQSYNDMLHQTLIFYLLVICLFIPGMVGLLAIIMASHLLYGIYYITLDLDSIIGGKSTLIKVNLDAIQEIAELDGKK